jgi:hypothetical protein
VRIHQSAHPTGPVLSGPRGCDLGGLVRPSRTLSARHSCRTTTKDLSIRRARRTRSQADLGHDDAVTAPNAGTTVTP